MKHPHDDIPDVRDGLDRKQRIILACLQKAQQELGDRNVPTILLYGRVLEHLDISQEEFQSILSTGLTRDADIVRVSRRNRHGENIF